MIRKLMTVVVTTVVAVSAREAHAQAVAVQATVAAPAAAAPAAPAEGGYRLPVSYTERGITNPEKILSPEVDFAVTNLSQTVTVATPLGPISGTASKAIVNLAARAGYSITDDFGVRATVIPLQLNSPFNYLGPSIGATYRFLKGDFEMGAAADVTLQTCSSSGCYNPDYGPGSGVGVVLVPSVPMRLHLLNKKAVLDLQPGIPIADVGNGGTTVGINVPVAFAYDIIEPVHVGASTGFGLAFNPPAGNVGDTFTIPFGIFGGYALAGKEGPMLDIDPFFLWPQLFTPAAQTGLSKANGAYIEVGVAVTYYLYL